ncbi:MAG: hypothetical protein JST73_02475 [Actinobacteria bacterium]|nr:hypothetical protein [Actinomycetota bacterium]
MGLIHPVDMAAYQRDAAARRPLHRVRRLRALLGLAPGDQPLWMIRGGERPDVLVAYDARSPSVDAAVGSVLAWLDTARVAVLSPFPFEDGSPFQGAQAQPIQTIGSVDALQKAAPGIRVVVSTGGHVPAGAYAHELAVRLGVPGIVVQHGMLLPQMAPLPPGVHLAAWSEQDAAFWCAGRGDVEWTVVGSELLARADAVDVGEVAVDSTPVFCGAMHGTELMRRETERIARTFCRATGAAYRPHPAETDVVSRATHLAWRRLGIPFVSSTKPLVELGTPVVAVWSTSVLEAATAGIPAWVYHPDPPTWLTEVWRRYGLSPWGSDPTPASSCGAGVPARQLADLVRSYL